MNADDTHTLSVKQLKGEDIAGYLRDTVRAVENTKLSGIMPFPWKDCLQPTPQHGVPVTVSFFDNILCEAYQGISLRFVGRDILFKQRYRRSARNALGFRSIPILDVSVGSLASCLEIRNDGHRRKRTKKMEPPALLPKGTPKIFSFLYRYVHCRNSLLTAFWRRSLNSCLSEAYQATVLA